MSNKKRITLHPLLDNGQVDLDTNLYPKTFLDGIVDREGNEVEVATKEDLEDFVIGPESSIDNNIAIFNDRSGKLIKDSDVNISSGDGNIMIQGNEEILNLATKNTPVGDAASYGQLNLITTKDANNYVTNITLKAVANSAGWDAPKNLGDESSKWNNLYLSGNLTDGNNSTTIENIVTKSDNQTLTGTKTFKDGIRFWGQPQGEDIDRFGSIEFHVHDTGESIFTDLDIVGVDNKVNMPNAWLNAEGVHSTYLSGEYLGDYDIYDYLQVSPNFTFRSYSANYGVKIPDTSSFITDKTLATTDQIGSKLYRHHFDIVLTPIDLPTLSSNTQVHINVNALSTNETAWQTLSELDGGGFIISAFGLINDSQGVPIDFNHIFELKIYYSSLGNGTLLLNVNDLTDNSVKCVALTTVFNGQSPNSYVLQDSVTPL